MLMGIIQKPTLWSYLSKNWLLETNFFPETVSLNRPEPICKFLYFVGNSDRDQYQGDSRVFKI
jgi:hypothetical protein